MAKSKKHVGNNVVYALLYILIGVLFIVFKNSILGWLMTIAGVVFIALGVLDILHKNITLGVIEAVIGIVIILGGWLFVEIVLIIFGALLIVKGATDLIKQLQGRKNTVKIIVAVLTIAVGILLIVSKWVALEWFFVLLGIMFIINGAFALLQK